MRYTLIAFSTIDLIVGCYFLVVMPVKDSSANSSAKSEEVRRLSVHHEFAYSEQLEDSRQDLGAVKTEKNLFIDAFHAEFGDMNISDGQQKQIRDEIAKSDDRAKLAESLIGAENDKLNYLRAFKVGMAMLEWPEDYAVAISSVLRGDNFSGGVGNFVQWQLENDNADAVVRMQSSLKMGSDRANVGVRLVRFELSKKSVSGAIERIKEISVPYDQSAALLGMLEKIKETEDLSTRDNFKLILDLAKEVGDFERIKNDISRFESTRETLSSPENE